jgi:hypothetical protein
MRAFHCASCCARLLLLGCLPAALLVFAPASSQSQARWIANGVPLCVHPDCGGFEPLACEDGAGGALVAWQGNRAVSGQDLFIQKVLHGGSIAPGWPAAGVLVEGAVGDQYLYDISSDGQGGAFVVWTDYRNQSVSGIDVYAQHVLGDGQIAAGWPGDGVPVSVAAGDQGWVKMTADGAGGVFIAFEDSRRSFDSTDVYALHLNGDGTRVAGWPENGLVVRTAARGAYAPYLCADRQGGCIIAWTDGRNNTGGELYAQRLTGSGEVVAGWPADGRQIISSNGVFAGRGIWGVMPDRAGGAYIAWDENHGWQANDDDVYAVRILADGSTAPGWPAAGFPVCALQYQQFLSGVAADSAGGVLLTWYDQRTGGATVAYAQRLRPDGTLAPGWQANGTRVSDAYGYHFAPQIAPDGLGGAYVMFEVIDNGDHDFVQHLTAQGGLGAGWPSTGVAVVDPWIFYAFQQREFTIVPDAAGGAIVAWNDIRSPVYGDEIYAQRYSGDGPTPTLVSLVSIEALPDRVSLTWQRAEGALAEVTIERRREGGDWTALGTGAFDGTGRLEFEDRSVTPGMRYGYRLRWSEAGSEQFSAESQVEVPAALVLALEGARPNPAVGELHVAFTLPREAPASLELLDVSGRQVAAREVGSLGPGRHLVSLEEATRVPPGVYWLRLTQASRRLVQRAAVLR